MAEEKSTGGNDADFPDPKGMQGWLEREIGTVMKAAELRVTEATNFVNAYARGEISQGEAAQRSYDYANRWGDALPGVLSAKGLTDDEILARLNEVRANDGLLDKHVLGRRTGGTPGTSR